MVYDFWLIVELAPYRGATVSFRFIEKIVFTWSIFRFPFAFSPINQLYFVDRAGKACAQLSTS